MIDLLINVREELNKAEIVYGPKGKYDGLVRSVTEHLDINDGKQSLLDLGDVDLKDEKLLDSIICIILHRGLKSHDVTIGINSERDKTLLANAFSRNIQYQIAHDTRC